MERGTARRSLISGENLMKEKLEDARDIVAAILDRGGNYPVGLVRVHRLLEQVLAEWWDEDEIVTLAEEPPLWFPDEPPFPAA
jgi:hypothetical protein